jgi:hypothetical protein
MRFSISIGLFLIYSLGAYCQHRSGFSPIAPPVVRPVQPMSAYRPIRPGGVRRPVEGETCERSDGRGGAFIPYVVPYPVYSNGGYYPDISDAYEQQPPPVMNEMPPRPPVQPAISNQYVPELGTAPLAANPNRQAYQAPPPPRPEPVEPQQPSFFIALKDRWVYTASAYWVEDGTLHYIVADGKHNQVSLSLVDRQTTARLNQGGEFHLPPQ